MAKLLNKKVMEFKKLHAYFFQKQKMGNKKGFNFNIGGFIAIVIAVIILAVAAIPTYTSSVDSAYSGELECQDAVLDTFNWTSDPAVCFNGTHMSVTEAPTATGLTSAQRSLMLLGVTFLVIGGLVFVGKKSGII